MRFRFEDCGVSACERADPASIRSFFCPADRVIIVGASEIAFS